MDFEWDEAKNRANIRKHGIAFEMAQLIFKSTFFTKLDLINTYGEDRFISIGKIDDIVVLVVVHTDRNERTRIISARPASRKERQAYYEKTR
jgi:uncharacterized DUF497 family protein